MKKLCCVVLLLALLLPTAVAQVREEKLLYLEELPPMELVLTPQFPGAVTSFDAVLRPRTQEPATGTERPSYEREIPEYVRTYSRNDRRTV